MKSLHAFYRLESASLNLWPSIRSISCLGDHQHDHCERVHSCVEETRSGAEIGCISTEKEGIWLSCNVGFSFAWICFILMRFWQSRNAWEALNERGNDRRDRRRRRRQKTRGLLLLAVEGDLKRTRYCRWARGWGEGIGRLDACCGQRQSIAAQRQRNEERERGRSLLLSSTVSPFIPSLTLSTISPSFPSLSTVFTYSPFSPVFSSK